MSSLKFEKIHLRNLKTFEACVGTLYMYHSALHYITHFHITSCKVHTHQPVDLVAIDLSEDEGGVVG